MARKWKTDYKDLLEIISTKFMIKTDRNIQILVENK